MTTLLIGFRVGAAKALERKKLPYVIWSEKPLLNIRDCEGIIISDFPTSEIDIQEHMFLLQNVTHVIAATESAVIPASKLRKYLNLYQNKESVITRCTDKLEMKKFLFSKNIPMTKFISGYGKNVDDIIESLGNSVVCKKRLSSGGRGVFFIENKKDINQYLNRKFYFEECIKGTEGSIESFIIDGKIEFTNITQYFKNGICNILPGGYSEIICNKIKALNENVIKALNIEWGMTHLEYYLLDNGDVLFGEVALRPPGGYIMNALEHAYDQNFWDLFVDVELRNTDISFNQSSKCASSVIIHPGEGVVKAINGKEEVLEFTSFKKLKLNIKIGDEIKSRVGVGQDCGYLLLANNDRVKLEDDINAFLLNFIIVL